MEGVDCPGDLMVMVPFLICRWSAVRVLSMLLLLGAGGGAAVVGLFSRTRVSLGVSTRRLSTWSWAPKGVRDASCGLMGPALPLSETVPLPGKWADAVKGKDFWKEKSFASRASWS